MTCTAQPSLTATACDRHTLADRHAGLDCSMLLPRGWRLELAAQPGRAQPMAWVELARARAPSTGPAAGAAVTLAGLYHQDLSSLESALLWMLRQRGAADAGRTDLLPVRMGRHVGLGATLTVGRIGVRIAVLEDGGRLLRLVLSAPAGSPALGAATWGTLAGGLVLHDRHGSTLPALRPRPAADAPHRHAA